MLPLDKDALRFKMNKQLVSLMKTRRPRQWSADDDDDDVIRCVHLARELRSWFISTSGIVRRHGEPVKVRRRTEGDPR